MALAEFLESFVESTKSYDFPIETVHSFVFRVGGAFESRELTDAEREYLEPVRWENFPEKECFWNSQVLAFTLPEAEDMEIKYVEGYFSKGWGIGIIHAWLSLNGKVLDPTLGVFGILPEGYEYYGVALDKNECDHSLDHHGKAVSLVDDYECQWPIIRRGPGN